jgi:hypothetical protein
MPSHQQSAAAANIQRAFLNDGIHYAILWAKCQSGKTGAYHALIKSMIQTGASQRAYIICGSAETILRSQAYDDAMEHNPEYVESEQISIIFHQDFKSSSMNLTNAIVIVDESHLVQTKGQGLHRFLGSHGITMDGNPTNLVTNNTYVVSVDATPYSEIAALSHKETPYEKHVENLQPGDGYIGLSEFYILGDLQSTYDISKNEARFTRLLTSLGSKYALMRLSNSSKCGNASEEMVRTICSKKGYNILYYTAEKTEIAITRKEQETAKTVIPCLEDAPLATTVVVIRGRLRAGKVVPKPHIGFVWEGAKASKTDTIVQGLAGRMCGYHTCRPLIFVPASSMETCRDKVLTHSEIERAIYDGPVTVIPRIATNLKKGVVASAPPHGRTACVPLRLEWDGSQLEDLSGNLSHLKQEARELLRRNLHEVAASEHYTDEQKAEICAKAMNPATTLHGRYMVASSSTSFVSFYKQILDGYKYGTATKEHVADFPDITYIIVETGFPGLRLPGASTRHVYVIFYTESAGQKAAIHLKSRISETTGKSIFSVDTSRFDRPIAAAGMVGIALEDIKTPAKLEARLRDYMTLWLTSALVVSREITAPDSGCFKLSKSHYHYNSDKDNDVRKICARLEVEFGLTAKQIVIKFARSGAKMFNIKSISW